jgi:hypothetical protein
LPCGPPPAGIDPALRAWRPSCAPCSAVSDRRWSGSRWDLDGFVGCDGVVIDALEARGASRGNAERGLVERRVFPQLALRASQQRWPRLASRCAGQRWHAAAAGRAAWTATPACCGSTPRRDATPPPLCGGHGRPEVRPPARLVAPWLRPRRAKAVGAMDGPTAVQFRCNTSRRRPAGSVRGGRRA